MAVNKRSMPKVMDLFRMGRIGFEPFQRMVVVNVPFHELDVGRREKKRREKGRHLGRRDD
jgi:hypothetical protein